MNHSQAINPTPFAFVIGITLLFMLCVLPVAAQTRQWSTQPGTVNADSATGIAVDNGYLYLVGATAGTMGRASQGQQDAFLVQFDRRNRVQLWVEQLGSAADDKATAVALDAFGNIYIAGTTTGIMPGGRHYGATDVWIAKYSSNGSRAWLIQIGTASEDFATGITVDQTGHVIVTGNTTGGLGGPNQGGDDIWFGSFDSSTGIQLWLEQLGTPVQDQAFSVKTVLGDILITGSTRGDLDGRNLGDSDAFIARYDSSGSLLWVTQFGTSAADVGKAIAVKGAGSILVAGYTNGAMRGVNAGGADAFLAQFDSGGFQLSVEQFGTSADDRAQSVAVDSLDRFCVAGETLGSLADANQGLADIWAAGYDAQGLRLWTHQTGSTSQDGLAGVAVLESAVYLSGISAGSLGGTNAGSDDSYVLEYSQSPTILSFTPTSGATGTAVTIRGDNYFGVTSVTFNNAPASFTVNSSSQITATLPAAASTGRIRVTTAYGGATSTTNFTVTTTPSVTLSVTPASRTVNAGQTTTYDINLARANYPGSVSFSVTGQPPGSTATFSNNPTTGNFSRLSVTVPVNTAAATYTLNIRGTATGINILPVTVTLRVNAVAVSLSATPVSRTVNAGQSTTYTININRTNFAGTIALSRGLLLPVGVSMTFNPSSTTGNSSTLTVGTSVFTPVGTHTLTIIGTASGPTIAPINVTLTVNQVPSVTLSASPTTRTVNECGRATYQVSLSRVNFTGAVALSVSGLPAGATASFNPASTNGNSSTLTVSVSDATTSGTWTLSISGTATNISITPINVTLTTYFYDWLSQMGGPDTDRAQAITVDDSGNVYVVGETWGDIDNAGAGTLSGENDAWLARYSSSGTPQWVRQFGTPEMDSAESVAVDSSGDIYVAGWTCGDLASGGSGTFICGAFLAKYNGAGTRLWVTQFDTYLFFNTELAVAIDKTTGDAYMTGSTLLDANGVYQAYTTAFVAKYNSSGTRQWIEHWGGAWEYATSNSVAVDDSGSIFVTGELNNNLPNYIPSVSLRKYDSSGTLQWVAQLDSTDEDYVTSVAVSGSNVYITGRTWGDLDGSGPGVGGDVYLAKYDSGGGALQWIRQFGSSNFDRSSAVAVDVSGNIYLSGWTDGDMDGPGPSTNLGVPDVFIVMYDASGAQRWVKQFGTSSSDRPNAGLAVDDSGSVFVAGETWGDLDGPGTGANMGEGDVWVGRFLPPSVAGPHITSFTPTSGLPGTSVTITGGNFSEATTVRFNGVNAVFTINSSTQITATVPNGATTGRISITTPCGTGVSTTDFIVPVFP